jgi:hypothetical protein
MTPKIEEWVKSTIRDAHFPLLFCFIFAKLRVFRAGASASNGLVYVRRSAFLPARARPIIINLGAKVGEAYRFASVS